MRFAQLAQVAQIVLLTKNVKLDWSGKYSLSFQIEIEYMVTKCLVDFRDGEPLNSLALTLTQ